MTEHAKLAGELFAEKGYNCAQAVACAFAEETGIPEETLRALSSSFGGGMGRLREVCGALTGAFMILGIRYGGYDTTDTQAKADHYARVQKLAAQFREECGSIFCRDIQPNPSTDPVPEERTQEYYKRRPCRAYVELAAELLDRWEEA